MNTKNLNEELKVWQKAKAEYDAHSAKNSAIYRAYATDAANKVRNALAKDGVTGNVRVSLRPKWENEAHHEVDVTVIAKGNDDMSFTIGETIKSIRAAGLSATLRDPAMFAKNLNDITEYYTMVGAVISAVKLGLPETVKALDNLTEPAYEEWTGVEPQIIENRISQINESIEVNSLDLTPSHEIEIYIEGKGRWNRSHWKVGTVVKHTAQSIVVCANGWNYHVKKGDVVDRLRNVQN
jgi:hypothetical protein